MRRDGRRRGRVEVLAHGEVGVRIGVVVVPPGRLDGIVRLV